MIAMVRQRVKDCFGTTEQGALATLAASVLFSLLVYTVCFINTANLLAFQNTPYLDLLPLLKIDPLAQWRLVLGFAILAGLYLVGWRAAQKLTAPTPKAWWIILGGALLAAVILLYLYPIDATDIFDSIIHGRIFTLYGGNPFHDLAVQYPKDPFYRYTGWRTSPTAYGPAWELLAGIAARVAGDGVVANVMIFKLLSGIFQAALVGVVATFLRVIAPERALAGAWLVAWNPLALYETFGNGHNDAIMAFWIVVAVYMLYQGYHTRAGLALLVGALFKYVSILLLPIAVLIALRSLPDGKARWRYLAVSTLAGAGLTALLFAPFWQGPGILTINRRVHMFTASLPSIVYQFTRGSVGTEKAAAWVSLAAASLTVLFTLWQAWRASRCIYPGAGDSNRTVAWESFTRASLSVLIFYLLVACLWFNPWYSTWLVGLAALLPAGYLQGLVIWIGYTGLSKTLVAGPLVFLKQPIDPLPWLELRLTAGVMTLPWIGSWWVLWKTRPKKGESTHEYH
ncbi:MAG: hypothetical protein PHQ40_19925 [Anaerolineaceae bacterium]|nr:hypothetical protein [Anaerolineaceae bacterium]